MRYFTSHAKLKEDERTVDEDDYSVLYEELNHRGVAYIRTTTGWRRKEFYVDVLTYDVNTTIEQVEDITRQALKIWNLADKVEKFTCNSLQKICDGNRFYYKRIYDLVPTSEMYSFSTRYKTSFASYVFLPKGQRACKEIVEGTPWKKSATSEIKRIFENKVEHDDPNDRLAYKHAFHYIFNGVANPKFKDTLSAIISARLKAGSLLSPNVFMFDLDNLVTHSGSYDDDRETSDMINEALAEALSGNTVVLKYGLHDRGGSYDEYAFKYLNLFIDVLSPHLDETLVVFAVPNLNANLELNIARRFDYPLVPLNFGVSESLGIPTKKEATRAFKELAAEDGIKVDSDLGKLFDETIEKQNFVSCEATYTRWKVSKRITDEFPNYDFALKKFDDVKTNNIAKTTGNLDELIGLKTVKEEINKVLAFARMEEVGRTLGIKSPERSLHLAFTGNPGTGKTEVARLYGKILNEAHVLSEGRVISINGADLGFPVDVDGVFEAAKGSVLFIDEAYAISSRNIIASLIANMENMRDEVVVILAGYSKEMEGLFSKNPGFKSRVGSVIEFPDYTADELFEIFKFMCKKNEITVKDDALKLVQQALSRQGRATDQGNARYVRTLFEQILTEQRVRLDALKTETGAHKFTEKELTTFTLADVKASVEMMKAEVDEEEEKDKLTGREELMQLIGLESVKNYATEVIDFFKIQRDRKKRGISADGVSMHMAFTGSPGTGKTEVARLMGKILAEEGILSVGDLIECGRADLIGDAVGTTAPKVKALFEKARGSILFIDEAYSLVADSYRGYSQEAIDTLIAEMENLRDEVVVIFAGYDDEIDKLFEANAGFASRVKTRIHFDDYSTDDMVAIFKLMAQKRSFVLDKGFDSRLAGIFDKASKKENFGNGRYVRNLLEETIRKQAQRIVAEMSKGNVSDKQMQTLKVEDIREPDIIVKKTGWKPVGFVS